MEHLILIEPDLRLEVDIRKFREVILPAQSEVYAKPVGSFALIARINHVCTRHAEHLERLALFIGIVCHSGDIEQIVHGERHSFIFGRAELIEARVHAEPPAVFGRHPVANGHVAEYSGR